MSPGMRHRLQAKAHLNLCGRERQLAGAGIWHNLLFAVLIVIVAYTLMGWVFGVQ